jgi:polar amino acid transport system substrate-binding protein
MKKILENYFFSILLLLLATHSVSAQIKKIDTNQTPNALRVGIAGSQPFVFNNEDQDGIALEIWDRIANKQEWYYELKSFSSIEKGLQQLNSNQIDMLIGPVSITSKRVKSYKFTQPFYQSSLGIASRNDENGLWQRIKPFFSVELLLAVSGFLLILAVVGTLLWLAERHESPDQFPKDPVKGIGNGMWLAIVTMSTTGYGDMAPITLKGRVIAGIWMVITLIFAGSMIAGIASTLTLSGLGTSTIDKIEEISGKNTATITGSPAIAFIKENKAKVTQVNSLPEAMQLLKDKKVDAVVYDRPQLLYYQVNRPDEEIYVAKAEYYKQGYGFAFPEYTNRLSTINLKLLELAEEQEIQEIVDRYLGKDD